MVGPCGETRHRAGGDSFSQAMSGSYGVLGGDELGDGRGWGMAVGQGFRYTRRM